MYDSCVISLILIVDSLGLLLMWKNETRKAKARTARKFNKILQSVGLKQERR